MNKNLKNYFSMFTLCISLFLLTSCIPSNSSDTYFGPLLSKTVTKNSILLTVAPNEPIAVCTNSTAIFNDIKTAILKWAAAIDRDKYMNIVACNGSNARVKITATSADTGYTPAMIMPSTGEITYSNNSAVFNDNNRFPILLHEIGHAWGLCDQYENKDVYGRVTGPYNCGDFIKGHGNSDKVKESVMGNATYSELQQDDIDGIRTIIGFVDETINKSWADVSKTTRINNDTTDDSAPHLAGNLTIGKYGRDYYFTYTKKDGSASSNTLKICLLDKSTCVNQDIDHTNDHPRIIKLNSIRNQPGKYAGNTSSSVSGSIKIQTSSKIYLIEIDEHNKVVAHKQYDIPESLARYL